MMERYGAIILYGGGPHLVNWWEFGGRYFWTAVFVSCALLLIWINVNAAIAGIDAIERKLGMRE